MSDVFKVPADTALIIVDVQNDFCPGGNLAVDGGDEIVPLINQIRKSFGTVIVTQDWHPATHKSFASNHAGKQPMETTQMPYGEQVLWPDHCVQNTEGSAFHKDLDLKPTDRILRKGTNPDIDSYSGFFENDARSKPTFDNGKTLAETLRDQGIKRVVVVGLAYDFCVGWHALDAKNEGFDAVVLKDATRSIVAPDPQGGPDTEQAMTLQLQQAGVREGDCADLAALVGNLSKGQHNPAPPTSSPS